MLVLVLGLELGLGLGLGSGSLQTQIHDLNPPTELHGLGSRGMG